MSISSFLRRKDLSFSLLVKKIKKSLNKNQMIKASPLFSIKLSKQDIVIDCGANVGDITHHLYKDYVLYYCFEPNPFAFEVLKNRFKSSQNIKCYQKGVWIENTKRELFFHENSDLDEIKWSTGSSFLKEKGNINKSKSIQCELIDLDEFILSLKQKVRILKIDIEGLECQLIKKLIHTNTIKLIDYVFVETHEKKIPALRKETKELIEIIKSNKIKNIDLNWI